MKKIVICKDFAFPPFNPFLTGDKLEVKDEIADEWIAVGRAVEDKTQVSAKKPNLALMLIPKPLTFHFPSLAKRQQKKRENAQRRGHYQTRTATA